MDRAESPPGAGASARQTWLPSSVRRSNLVGASSLADPGIGKLLLGVHRLIYIMNIAHTVAGGMMVQIVSPPQATPAILAICALTYLGVAAGHVPGLKLNRTGVALLGAIAMMIFTGLSTRTVVDFINWPTVLLLFGLFVLSAQLRLSGFFDKVANDIAARLDSPGRFLLILMLVTAGLSAFLNHDIVCFVFAPVVATALLRRRLNPVPFLIALAVASNVGAAATL